MSATEAHAQRGLEPKVISASRRLGTVARLAEFIDHREVFAAFLIRRVKVRYKQAVFGVAWVILQPLATAAVFAFFLGHLAGFSSGGYPYFLLVLTGLAVWGYFSQTVAGASEILVQDAGLLRKLYFPREIPPLSAVGAGLVDLSVTLGVLVCAVMLFWHGPALIFLALPLVVLSTIVLAAAAGLLLSGLNVYYRDVAYGLPFLIQVGLFASPVIYSTAVVPRSLRLPYEVLNPIAGSIQAVRDILLARHSPDYSILGLGLTWALILLVASYAVFKRLERRFADVV